MPARNRTEFATHRAERPLWQGLHAGKRRRVAVITGTRAEYGLLRSTLRAIHAHPRLELLLVATGMHLLSKFGRTEREIAADGLPIAARIPMQRGDDDPVDQAQGLARGVNAMARFFERAAVDTVLVLGDRIEAAAGALAAVTTGRLLAHVHGGDVAPGDFDQALRDAITMLADWHLVSSPRSRARVIGLGCPPERVVLVGAPGLDELRERLAARGILGQRRSPRGDGQPQPGHGRSRGNRREAPTALVVYHACGRPPAVEEAAMRAVLAAARAEGLRRVIVYPNSDRGHSGVIRAIERHARAVPAGEVEVHCSLPRSEYLDRLIDADVLLGNSSSGILEAPLAGTPSVNVGARQAGREPGGPTIVPARESLASVRTALRRALRQRPVRGCRSPYGDGRAGARIAKLLARL